MSHLKKFSDKLNQNFLPRILKFATIESIGTNNLEQYSPKIININKKIKNFLVPSLFLTASQFGLCSLSCNNVNLNQSVFVIHNNLEVNKWTGYQGKVDDYSAFLNPSVLSADDPIIEEFEYCPSVPFLKAKVQRHSKIEVEYMTLEGEYKQEQFEGFKARVFMHELDHLETALISSFSVNFGNLYCTDPEKHYKVDKVVNKYKEKLEIFINILDDRYLSDPEFKSKADEFGDKREFFIENIVDEEFDGEMHLELMEAVRFHLNT